LGIFHWTDVGYDSALRWWRSSRFLAEKGMGITVGVNLQVENPFRPAKQGHGVPWHDDEIGVAGCLLSLVNAVRNCTEPTYGPQQARLDQELVLAIRQSSLEGGRPIQLPMDPAAQTV